MQPEEINVEEIEIINTSLLKKHILTVDNQITFNQIVETDTELIKEKLLVKTFSKQHIMKKEIENLIN